MAHFGDSELSAFLDGIKNILDEDERQQCETLEALLKGVQAENPSTVATAGLPYWIGRLEFFQSMTNEEQLGYGNQFLNWCQLPESGCSRSEYDFGKAMYLLPRVVEYAGTVRPRFYIEGRIDLNFFVWLSEVYLKSPTQLRTTLANMEENKKEKSEVRWVNGDK